MRDPENRAGRLVGLARDFPAVREHNLLDDRQAEARSFRVCRKIGFENFGAIFRRDAGAVVGDLNECTVVVLFAGANLDLAILGHGLDGVEDEIEQRLGYGAYPQ